MALLETSELHPGVRQLLLNRPDKLNALSTAMMEQLDTALDAATTDAQVRVLVLRGAGGRAFVAGADIAEYQGNKREAFVDYQENGRRIYDKLEQLPKPVICAVDGFAFGGGFEIALCCDIILATEAAQLGLPEGRLGLSPGGGGTLRLTRAVGKHIAADVMLAGWRLVGQRAYELGLVAALAKDSDALGKLVEQRARACLKVAPQSAAQMKKLIRNASDLAADEAKKQEHQALFKLYSSADGQEGIDAFLEKRSPDFKGEQT